MRRVLFCVGAAALFTVVLSMPALGAEPNAISDGTRLYELPPITVEGIADSNYTTLPPRDLIKRPYTESPGLTSATSVIGRREIDDLHAYSIVDAMKYVPGAWMETRGRKVKQFFSVRGQRYPYPGYTIDGVWFREFEETNYFFNAANVERLEIVRSSSALLLGPGAINGMVNIIPRDYTERETRLDTLFGTNNTFRTYLSHGDGGEAYSYGVGAGFKHTDGPGENSRENMTDTYMRLRLKASEDLTLSLASFIMFGDQQLRLAKPPATNQLQTRRESFDPMSMYVLIGKALYQPSDRASTDIGVGYAKRRFFGHRQGFADQLEEDFEYTVSAMQSLQLTDRNTLRFGGMFNQWESPTGKRFYVGFPGDLYTVSGVVVDEIDLDRLNLNFGYRWSRTYYRRFGGFNVEGTAITSPFRVDEVTHEWEDPLSTVSAGASYELTDFYTLYGNITVGEVSATPGMLDTEFQRPGTETRHKYDLGIKKYIENFGEAALTGFYVYQDEAALLSGTSVRIPGTVEDFALFESADRDNYGLELDIHSLRFKNGLQFFANFTAMQTRRTTDGNWAKDREVPEFIFGGGASYLFGDFELSMFTTHISQYENDRFLPAGTPPAPLGDFTEVNMFLTYYCGQKKQNRLFVGVENIGDKHYSTVNGYPDYGRRFIGGMTVKF